MKRFTMMKLAVITAALAMSGWNGAYAQEVDAQVPVAVNVDANVYIDPPAGGGTGADGSVTGGTQKTFGIKLAEQPVSVSHRPQKQARAGAWVSHTRGNVTLNLHPEQYQNAAITLHSVNGKRVLNGKASASKGTVGISRANVPPGVYLLSVKGTKGNSFTTKLTHSGNTLNINAAFGDADSPSLSKSAADNGNYGEWTITVLAAGYGAQTRKFTPTEGVNAPQSFTLTTGSGQYALTVNRSPAAGGRVLVGNAVSTGTTLHNADAQVAVKAEAAVGYVFTGWSGASTSTNASITVNMRMSQTLTANFDYVGAYTLTVERSPAEGGKVFVDNAEYAVTKLYHVGTRVTASIKDVALGYVFTGWSGASTSPNTSVTLTMNSNLTLTANFENVGTRTLTIAKDPAAGGKVFVNDVEYNNATTHTTGAQVAVRAEASAGYIFSEWSGASTSKGTAVTLAMDSDLTLTGKFKVNSLTDSRDGKSYRTVRIGDYIWMAENLNFSAHQSGDSWCYGNTTSNCTKYGRLYNYDAAMESCPAGWHLPDRIDWANLVEDVGSPAGTKLKSQSGWSSGNGTDDYGFAAMPGGDRNTGGNFAGENSRGRWWSATTVDGSSDVYYREIGTGANVTESSDAGGNGFAVRCVEDGYAATATYTITVNASVGGSVNKNPVKAFYNRGEQVTITATPEDGYFFAGWTGGQVANANSLTTTVIATSNMTLTANFTEVLADSRDGKVYSVVKIGNQTWMAENLNYTTSNSWCYDNQESNCNTYGRLYTWDAAMRACPVGWHLPSNTEWTTLTNYVGASTVGTKLKSKTGWNGGGNGTDDFGFSALPGGGRLLTGGSFYGAGLNGNWWSSTEYGSGYAYFRVMYSNGGGVDESGNDKGFGFSVRCVKD
ncbi:MAG: InlB B-repeat-containing protein [Chitinispirillia bacterium]|nr:InlB B-repeat-containing protein [Chitinispirillia bacterium]